MFKLLPLDFISTCDVPANSKVVSAKEMKVAEKLLNIASEKCGGKRNALQYDITAHNYLYDGDYMTATKNKSLFMEELEAYIPPRLSYEQEIPNSAALLIDFMSLLRTQGVSATKYHTFGELAEVIYCRCRNACPHEVMHIVLDSYRSDSLKGPERDRRGSASLELAKITTDTPIPKQMDKFWASSDNKVLLQNFIADEFLRISIAKNNDIVLSGTLEDQVEKPCKRFSRNSSEWVEIPSLKSSIEEADHRVIPHIRWCLQEGCKDCVIISNDTDVLVLLLHFYGTFSLMGLERLWIRVGNGERRRFIPIHTLHAKLPSSLVKVLLPAYIGTGCDYLSKLGTKHGALKADPARYLYDFEKHDIHQEDFVRRCEQYLVKVFRISSLDTSFDGLRYSEYKNGKSVLELPPTSHSIIHGHLPRWYYIVKDLCSLLNPDYQRMDPLKNGWKMDCYSLLPQKELLLLPEKFTIVCSCKLQNLAQRC